MAQSTKERKQSHLSVCAKDDVSFRRTTTLFEEMDLVHRALGELNLSELDLGTSFCDAPMSAPLFIGAMTGGAGDNGAFNRDLAKVAAERRIGLCLGSMRPMLEDKKLDKEFKVRKIAPDIPILANLGGQQLLQYQVADIVDGVRRIGANGIAVHLNAGMELIQPHGDKNFNGIALGISRLVEAAGDLIVTVKETGMGLSYQDGKRLRDAGVSIVETAGAGGTSWVGVETCRAEGRNKRLGNMLWDFGIPTAVSTAWMVDLGFTVIASGGVYSGLDMARALSLGARYTAVARPLVIAYEQAGIDGLAEVIDDMITGLQYAMLCVGAPAVADLRRVPRVMGSRLTRYIETGWQPR